MERNLKQEYKLVDGKCDIVLMSTIPVIDILDDTYGEMGIASQFVTQKKAAEIMGISMPTLRRYSKLGFITRFTHGGRRYYRIEELELAKSNLFSNY